MFCKQCGSELKEGAMFCTNCGAKQGANDAQNTAANDFDKTVVGDFNYTAQGNGGQQPFQPADNFNGGQQQNFGGQPQGFNGGFNGGQPQGFNGGFNGGQPQSFNGGFNGGQQQGFNGGFNGGQQQNFGGGQQGFNGGFNGQQGGYQQPQNGNFQYFDETAMRNGAPHVNVSFGEAIVLFFKNYVNFSGRASRGEYWWAFLFNFLVSFAAGFLAVFIPPISWIVSLGFLLPGLSLYVRRMHDIGKPWYRLFIGFIPLVGVIFMIIDLCKESDGDNKWGYGPNRGW